MSVIDGLEVVDVDEQDSQRLLDPPALQAFQVAVVPAPVRQAGELVDQGVAGVGVPLDA
jgi:hypothetical protein